MITVVCVYNNERTLKNVLLKSLANQTAEFELITLDNAENRYRSAAEAYNYGGAKAKGDYIIFSHQDMWLGSDSWLEDVEKTLESIPDLGIAGVAGTSERGSNFIERLRFSFDAYDEGCSSGIYDEGCWEEMNRVEKPEEVQTLDECLLIVPRPVFSKLEFDEKVFDGWHCYGADYCLSVRQLGLRAYVIPTFSSHSCLRRNMEDLLKYQQRLYIKHKVNFKHIYTWMGDISWLKLKLRSIVPLYNKLFPHIYTYIQREVSQCESVLDLGCGHHSPIHMYEIPFSVGVELFEPYLKESKRKGIHSQYLKADIRRLEFKPKSFDAVTAFELLEHLTKQEGCELLDKAAIWARKKVIITTPNGYALQGTYGNNPLRENKSGWDVSELRDLGFKVRGFYGWKRLRGPRGELRYKPAFLWRRVSDLTDKIAYYFPKLAFLLLASKRIDGVNQR